MTGGDENSNIGIIIGVVVAIVVVVIIGALVATLVVLWYRHDKKNGRADFDEPRERSDNHRPTTLEYSARPLLNSDINTYTSCNTATATPLNGAYALQNPQNPSNQESNHQNNGEDVQDDDFGEENADSSSVTVQF